MSRTAVIFLFVVVAYICISSVSSSCGPNEEFKACGPSPSCEPTCAKPRVNCPEECVRGCHCVKGHVRNAAKRCVPVSQCKGQ
ncbi:chymotrypsin inhibitor-like [Bombus vosnesenskii]|uniref:Chymotrypsin inhibitor-like n=1 Tax=Bombus vosnesenskii TaxID=207650 RepID=A0A6J3LBY0_9HYME|nr:chymotrypsin inhibitor-like [Bombus vosnesenskii]